MYGRLLALVIFTGLAIGFFVPMGPPPAQTAAPIAIEAVTPARAPRVEKPIETVLKRADNGHFYVDAEVNGQLVHFMVDTGASTIALTKADAQHAAIQFWPGQFTVIGRGVSGDVMGQEIQIGHIAIDQKEAYDQRAVVVDDGLDVSLLGQSFLSKIGTVVIEDDRMILR
jgi:aspartyl protease family protein